MNEEKRKRLAELSGDTGSSKFPKYVLPTIALNGNTGEFTKSTPVEKSEPVKVVLTKPVELVILRKRRNLATKMGISPEFFTSEFSSPNDIITLYEKIENKVVVSGNGTAPQLRAANANLKTVEVLYCLYNGEIVKVVVRGGSSGNYYDFQNKMGEEGKHSFEYILSLGAVKQKNEKMKKDYYAMTFAEMPLTVDADLIEEKMMEVNVALKKIDDYQASKVNQSLAKPHAEPTVDYGDTEEINPDDIPF